MCHLLASLGAGIRLWSKAAASRQRLCAYWHCGGSAGRVGGLVTVLGLALVVAFSIATTAHGQSAEPPALAPGDARPSGAHLQTLLARSGFSPGLIDGKVGRKTRTAIQYLQQSRGLPETAELDDATLAALLELSGPRSVAEPVPDRPSWTRPYTVTDADLSQVTGPIPEDWNERAQRTFSGYIDVEDMLAERGWCSIDLLRQLNPDIDLQAVQPGQQVTLPSVDARPLPKLARVRIDLEAKLVLGFNDSGTVVSLMHCSIARDLEKRPVGELHVKVVVTDPDYTFNPASWPEVTNVDRKLRIAPGPRNPVGRAWIGLDRSGYGLHGTVRPQDIGKTGSHGCFRLANWDAQRLVRAVSVGMPVEVHE